MLRYWPIIVQETVEDKDLRELSQSDISDLEKNVTEIYPLLVPFMKASFMWPYWTGAKKYGAWVLVTINALILTSTFFYVVRITSNDELDMNIATELCVQLIVQFIVIFGMYILILDKQGALLIQKLLVIIVRNWLQSSSEERKFLKYYINIAKFTSFVIAGLICSAYTMYAIIIPVLWPVTANLILRGNHTYEQKLSIHFELYIDEETHFYSYVVPAAILCYTAEVFVSSLGISYIFVVAFVIAKFRFMGFKLKQILNLSRAKDYLEKDDEIFNHIHKLVQLHQFCIYTFDLMNTMTSPILFFGTLFVIVSCSISGCLIVIKIKQDINFALRMGFVYIMSSEFLFVTSHPSQMIANASADIFDDCYYTDWYKYSTRTRKMIQLMMIRSLKPSYAKIGPSQYANYETTRKILQLSFSYVVSLMSIYNP